eukprot:c20608_g1_i1 orf=408-1841(+)
MEVRRKLGDLCVLDLIVSSAKADKCCSRCRCSGRFVRLSLLVALAVVGLASLRLTDAYDPLDPNGNITIKWDVMQWTPDGYVAVVTMYNFQQYRHIQSPGWVMGWNWAQREIIWSMVGAQATLQGDCSKFTSTIPHCCKRDPSIVDLLPGVPYNNQISNCCKGGVLASWAQDPQNAVASFQVSVGRAGTSNTTVRLPKNFTLNTPGPGYTCSPAKVVKSSLFASTDGRRHTQSLMTWNVTCTYSQFLAHRAPTCCVSLSSFYNDTIVPCPTCSCSCQDNSTADGCLKTAPLLLPTQSRSGLVPLELQPELQCTTDMCPIRVHWHVKTNYKAYWRVKLTITNRNYARNYSQWNIVAQHPNFNNLTEVFSFTYKGLTPYGVINDTAMFWGIKYYNDMLMSAGPDGNVQSEILFQKDQETFSFKHGWAFPQRLYFNGDSCVLPPPDAYPWLPNGSTFLRVDKTFGLVIFLLATFILIGFL